MLIDKWNIYEFAKSLSQNLGKLIFKIRLTNTVLLIDTTPNNLRSVLYFLQNHSLTLFKQLQDITCVDQPQDKLRYRVSYILYSVEYNTNIIVSVQTDEVIELPSITPLYENADWLEREVWDLFGVFFYEHPDLRRILTDYGFDGNPFRKDFPLSGFVEIYYNDQTKRICYERIELAQEARFWTLC